MINQLLVLGLVPGTDLQITFSELLITMEVVLLLYLIRERLPLQKMRGFRRYALLYLSTKKGQQLRLQV